MSSDPLGSLTPAERIDWERLVGHVRRDMIGAIDASAMVILPFLTDRPDAYAALQLGMALLLDKPLLLITSPGADVPARLRRVADAVVEADPDTGQGQEEVTRAIKRLTEGRA